MAELDTGTTLGDDNTNRDQVLELLEFLAKGDIIVGTGAGTIVRLPAGVDGTVLSYDSGETSGMKAIPAAGAQALRIGPFISKKDEAPGGTFASPISKRENIVNPSMILTRKEPY